MDVRRPRVGEPAPPLELVDADGRAWRSSDHRGRPILAVFHRHLH